MDKTAQPPLAEAAMSFGGSQTHCIPVLNVARSYCAAGLSVIPIRTDGSKAPPEKWKQFEDRLAEDEELARWFGTTGTCGIGVVCGKVSGGLEVIDFDLPELFPRWCEVVVASGGDGLLGRVVEIETPSGGRHLIYRCSGPIPGNDKLARAPKPDPLTNKDTWIETRGEGGYIVAPGSPAYCHELNRPYTIIRGSLSDIPIITSDERDLLIHAARGFNQKVKDLKVRPEPRSPAGERPGDRFNASATWSFLKENGWVDVTTSGTITYWRRPGKSTGISATTNYAGLDIFYCFTSNGAPFEANTGYKKFTAFALLDHGGDFAEAARALVAADPAKYQVKWPALDDIGNAQRFVNTYGDDVVWVGEVRKWFVWNGSRWEMDVTERTTAMAKMVARNIFKESENGS